MESYLHRYCLWPLCSGGTTVAKAKRLMMQHLSDDIICEEGLADGGCALWNSLAAAFKDKMAVQMPYVVDEMETLKLKQGETIDAHWSQMTILRSDLKDLGYKCTDTSIVQCMYRSLKLQPSWKTSMCHLSESVAAVKRAKFKI